MEKFHQYVYGRPIVVHSDHRPLETIWKRPLGETPRRLQRMLLRLRRYDIKLIYVSGRNVPVAYALSHGVEHTMGNSSKGEQQDNDVLIAQTDYDGLTTGGE